MKETENKTDRIFLRVTPDLKNQITIAAKQAHLETSQYIRIAVIEKIEKTQKENDVLAVSA